MTFNLVDEPWIPVMFHDGVGQTVSMRECFARAGDIRRLGGDLPTQSFAILRVLLAICHDAIGFHSDDAVARQIRSGLDTAAIDAYLDRFHDRFDLFDPQRPFFQVATLRTGKGEVAGLEKLISDVPNGAQFLTVRAGSGLESISAAEAARWLIHCQAFDPSGIRSAAVGDAESIKGKGYPIGPAWAGQIGGIVIHGRSLAETLVLNLVPVPANPSDRPVWALDEAQTEQREIEPHPPGPVSLLTWQSRRIRLVGDRASVTAVVLAQGDKMTPQNRHGLEAMTAWRYSKPQTKKLGIPVYMPLKHDPSRDLWRGLPAMLSVEAELVEGERASLPAQTVRHLAGLWEDVPGLPQRVGIEAVGMTYGPQEATVDDLVNDRLDLRVSLLGEQAGEVVQMVQDTVATTDTCVWNLGRLAGNLARAAGDFDGVDGAAADARSAGWAALDAPARAWVAGLSSDTDTTEARRAWQEVASSTLLRCARDLANRAGPAATIGRRTDYGFMTTARAESTFAKALREELPLAYPQRTKEGAHV